MTRRTIVFTAALLVFLLPAAGVAPAQTARTSRLMREKLLHSQRILASVTTSDYALMQKETQALTKITQSQEWNELMMGGLRPYTTGFVKALADLTSAAERRDYDAAGSSFTAMTTACIQCHKHVMKSRIAGR